MTVEVRLFAGLNKYVQGTGSGEPFAMALEEDDTLEGLLSRLGIPRREAFVTMVNGQASPITTVLKDNDRIGIFPAVGGG